MPVSTDELTWFGERFAVISDNIEHVIQGKRETVELVTSCLISGGHALIEDVPGVGKTLLAKSLARSIDCSFQRIQFTPDLLPSDVTGVSVWDREDGDFVFRPGPVFANVVLADAAGELVHMRAAYNDAPGTWTIKATSLFGAVPAQASYTIDENRE